MKSTERKGVGIYQAIPMDVMVDCVRHLLKNGVILRQDVIDLLAQYPRGGNRLDKAREHATKIFVGEKKESAKLAKFFPHESSAFFSEHEIEMIAIALSALSYPAFYHLLVTVAQQFKVQPVVSRAFINQKMGDIYGGNRSIAHGVDAIIPMLVESGLIQRKSTGLYEKGIIEHRVISLSVCEYWVRVDLILSGSKAFLADELVHHPWSEYCPGIEQVLLNPKLLKIDTMVGSKAYIRL